MTHRIIYKILAMLVIGLTTALPLAGSETKAPLQLTRISPGSIEIDGDLDDAPWESIPAMPLIMFQPEYQGDMTEKSEIRVAYDDQYFYVGAWFYDNDPENIRANSMDRDRYSNDDALHIILDTFNDDETAKWFMVVPNGIRIDAAISEDAEGSFFNWMNPNWNSFWDAAAELDEEGWFVEVRIPFSSLGFEQKQDTIEMGMIIQRYIARKNERHIYPEIAPKYDSAQFKPSLAQSVVLTDISSQNPVYFSPYVLTGAQRLNELNDPETAWIESTDWARDIGIDLKANLTSNVALDLTVNTDFAQVESDEEQVNLTRFDLFFEEKRQFFQERSGIFEFGFGRRSRLFYSRKIGLDEDGRAVRILGGGRLVGRLGAWDVGLLNMQTGKTESVLSENFGVLRLRRQIINTNSYTGFMFTNRIDRDGVYNSALGFDTELRLLGDEYATFRFATTRDKGNSPGFVDASRFRVGWRRNNSDGLSYLTGLSYSGKDFNPGMGFVRREDFKRLFGVVEYGIYSGKNSKIRKHGPFVLGSYYLRNEDDKIDSGFLTASYSIEMKSGASLDFGVERRQEDILEEFELSERDEIFVLPGEYSFNRAEFSWEGSEGNKIQPEIDVATGQFYGGWMNELELQVGWNASKYLEVGGEYEFNGVNFDNRGLSFDSHVLRVRFRGAVNNQLSINAFLQYGSLDAEFGSNIRLRYNVREGNDLYIVYNENRNTDRDFSDLRAPAFAAQTFVMKYTYTFIR